MREFSIAESLRFGWETFKKRPLFIAGAFLISFIVSSIFSWVDLENQGAASVVLIALASLIVGTFVEIGLLTFSIRAHDRVESVTLHDLWNPSPFIYYLVTKIIAGLAVTIGLVLLVVPGLIAAVAFLFSSYSVIDKRRSPLDALKESARITKGHRLKLFLFLLSIAGINIIGLLALVVGLLVTIPVSMFATVHVYRLLERGDGTTSF